DSDPPGGRVSSTDASAAAVLEDRRAALYGRRSLHHGCATGASAGHAERDERDDQPECPDEHQDDADCTEVQSVHDFGDGEIADRADRDEKNADATSHNVRPSFFLPTRRDDGMEPFRSQPGTTLDKQGRPDPS